MNRLSSDPAARLMSLDVYRGFVMLAMASGGLGLAEIVRNSPEFVHRYDGTRWQGAWTGLWENLAFHFDHVAWHGCAFWDLIQPSFMFLVGVALPFSLARRESDGQSSLQQFGHVLVRSFVLIALGIFLASNGALQTDFVFTNVLTQIGLGYPFLYLLAGRPVWLQVLVAAAVLGGYGAWFAYYKTPQAEEKLVREYVSQDKRLGLRVKSEFDQFWGRAAAWNKHFNPAAAADRVFLNLFPREKPVWNGRRFWVNQGGYQTLNFVPSFVTMLLGLLAGRLLRSELSQTAKLWWLFGAGLFCFLVSLGLDTKMWPVHVNGWFWSYCPIVKRIWTPTWALFSSGWTFWMLAAFYGVVDVLQWRRWAFPLVVVGMNSIAIYCAAQLLKPWLTQTAKTHLATLDAAWGTRIISSVYESAFHDLWLSLIVVGMLWLMCLWLYRQKIFVRI